MDSERIDQCVQAVRAGNREAFGEIVRLTQDRLRAYLLQFCPWPDSMDDVAQESYVYAYRHLAEYACGTDFFAWLRVLARHRARSCLRAVSARSRRERRYADALLAERVAERPETEAVPDRLQALRACIQALPRHARALLEQRYALPADEFAAAEREGQASAALRVTLFRIRERLRLCVESKQAAGRGSSA